MKIKNLIIVINFLLFSGLLFLSSCDEAIYGSGNIIEETRDVSPFDAIDVSGAYRVYLYQGDNENLVIETDDNVMEYVRTQVRGGKLFLDTRYVNFRRTTINVHVTVKDLEEIKASGAVKIIGQTPLQLEYLGVNVSGASDVDLEVFADQMELKMSGAGKSHLTGEVDKMTIKLSGASKISAETLWCRAMDIKISGAGSANVNVDEKLVVKISGAGNLRYLGNPNVRSNISGAGNVSRLKN
ncbi:MAG TPA: DUF2807 domain-containing protein [Bacteroidales bacterium]|nr:DUF2807 domain-containing protein [Bacteroidales bacterium]